MLEAFGFFLAILMGVSLGLVGGGGSILTVPLLVYFFKMDGVSATTSSLLIVGLTSLVGATLHAKNRNIEYKLGFIFAVPSLVSLFFVRVFILPLLPQEISFFGVSASQSSLLLVGFSVIMLLAGRAMIRSNENSLSKTMNSNFYAPVISRGLMVGAVTGFVGAGGGFLIIPALVILFKLPMKSAVGTSLAMIAFNSLFGFFVSADFKNISFSLIFSIIGCGILGLGTGMFFAQQIDGTKLKKLFGYFVLCVGGVVLFDQLLKIFMLA